MLLDRAALCVVGILVFAGCAGSAGSRAPASAPEPANVARASPTESTAQPASAGDRAGTTGLTGAEVSSTEAPSSGWTDDRILGILIASNAADLEQATIAQERARDVRISRYAEHLRNDDHVLGERARALAERVGTHDSAERLEVDVEHGGFLVAMRDALPEKFDDVFLRAQIEQSTSLLRLIDEELLPAAVSPEVAALAREVRAGAAYHLSIARSIRLGSGTHLGR